MDHFADASKKLKYTFYVIGVDGTPMYPDKTGDQMAPIEYWTINIEKALTWDNIEDFDCLLPEYYDTTIVAIFKE